MRFFLINDSFQELAGWPDTLPTHGFVWVTTSRPEFEAGLGEVQAQLQRLAGGSLVDLHVKDLLNVQLPSQYDYTSWYDLLVFRRLAPASNNQSMVLDDAQGTASGVMAALATIDTSPVGFVVFDRVLLTVHPADCTVRDFFELRLSKMTVHEPRPDGRPDGRGNATRLPPNSADLMVRIINHMVDSYLDLRRLLTRQSAYLQQELLSDRTQFTRWQELLDARNTLHLLEDICEDQRGAVQEWIDALDEWPWPTDPQAAREREVLRVRSRDVQEHIERVLGHVRRLETSSEGAVQIHFSLQGNRANAIMRTLTVLTAVFLPLNLITGIFGMNFDFLPLIHSREGFWMACGLMATVLVGLLWFFRRKRYISDR